MENSYDKIPVYYCSNCLSLAIIGEGEEAYCNNCGSTIQGKTDITDWKFLYFKEYKKTFVDYGE